MVKALRLILSAQCFVVVEKRAAWDEVSQALVPSCRRILNCLLRFQWTCVNDQSV